MRRKPQRHHTDQVQKNFPLEEIRIKLIKNNDGTAAPH